jgi:hypothetical protein
MAQVNFYFCENFQRVFGLFSNGFSMCKFDCLGVRNQSVSWFVLEMKLFSRGEK